MKVEAATFSTSTYKNILPGSHYIFKSTEQCFECECFAAALAGWPYKYDTAAANSNQ